MELGAFSVSLNVRDIQQSYDFYKKLGFEQMGGNIDQKWLILRNGTSVIGLFQGMFEKNILTFNPGWDQNAVNLENFQDVREIQNQLKAAGLSLDKEADENSSGPEHFVLKDPDGNVIMLDQHR
ncbi:VOC family protein [Kaistella sp. PBT33-4]|uniref:VOC family protein n=1 Tax=Kaistella sp. PBT33-4 TaxID=3032000 RepID=UPI0023D8BA35|nr:VOC family protein [Kaistella sp. PBT33-4]MDF0720260.1 VOC family protein [Kaistella sp. PBT33-4]